MLDSGVAIALGSLDEFARSVLDEDTLALVSLISDVKLGAISRAAAAADALAAHNAADPVAQDWRGIIRIRQQRYDEAIALFDTLIKAHPKFLDARRNRAHAYAAAGKADAAQKAWQEVLDQAPGDEQAYLGLSELALKAGDMAKGAAWLEAAQRNAQSSPAAGLTALGLYVSMKDWDHALPLAEGLATFFKFDPKVANARAQVLAAAGHVDQAKDLYDHFLRISPDAAEAFAGKAQLLAGAGDKSGARAALIAAIAVAPGEFGYEKALVEFDDANKGQNEALKTAQSFAQKDPVGSALLSATLLIKYDRNKDAAATLKAAEAQHPDAKLVILLAQLLAASGDASAAEATAQSWLNDHPQDWQVRLQLANLYAARHADDDAFAAYLRVATLAPRDATVLNYLALAAAKKSDPRARDWAERAYYLAPSAQSADTYGWILTGGGQPQAALPLLQAALAGAPDNASIAYHLAATLDAAGQKDAAKTLLQSVLKSGDQFEERQQAERLLASLQPG
jgi:putative PEP-CTERM system TPR-repeat lipoprotein